MFFVCVCNLILSYRNGRRRADEGQQQITALLRIVTEKPNFALVEEDVPISKQFKLERIKNVQRVGNHK
jgi:hypothetical protein